MKDEVDFLPADKRQMFPQIEIIILSVWPGMPKLPKITSLSNEVDFLHGDKHEKLLQIDTVILLRIVKHFQSSQDSKFTI